MKHRARPASASSAGARCPSCGARSTPTSWTARSSRSSTRCTPSCAARPMLAGMSLGLVDSVRGARPRRRRPHVHARPGQPAGVRPPVVRAAQALRVAEARCSAGSTGGGRERARECRAPTNPGGVEGMLTLDALRDAVAADADRHRGRRVHRPLRPARAASATTPGMFVDEVAAHGTHGCDYLLTTDMEMEPVPGYDFANWELGYGDVHLVPDLATLRRRRLARPHGARAVRRGRHPRPRAGRRRAPVGAAPPGRRRGRARAHGRWPPPSSSTTSTARRTATRRAGGFADLDAAGWYLEDYHLLQGARTEDVHRGGAPPPAPLGRARRELEGRVGRRPARAQRPLRRRARRWPTATSSSSSA